LQRRPPAGGEAIERAVDQVLGQVDALAARIDRGCLVLEHAHCVVRPALAPTARIALPYAPLEVLLAREPGGPRRRPPRAVVGGALQDPVGIAYLAVRPEAHSPGPAPKLLGVGDQDPSTVPGRKRGRAVRGQVPCVFRMGHDLVASGDATGGEALGQQDAVCVGPSSRAVAGRAMSGGACASVVAETPLQKAAPKPSVAAAPIPAPTNSRLP